LQVNEKQRRDIYSALVKKSSDSVQM